MSKSVRITFGGKPVPPGAKIAVTVQNVVPPKGD
jgi:hypothetical protein